MANTPEDDYRLANEAYEYACREARKYDDETDPILWRVWGSARRGCWGRLEYTRKQLSLYRQAVSTPGVTIVAGELAPIASRPGGWGGC